jgi:hypothetical protein
MAGLGLEKTKSPFGRTRISFFIDKGVKEISV